MSSFLRKHRVATVVVFLVFVTGAWYLFRPEKLFINKHVNEAAPFPTNDSEQPVYTGRLQSKLHETSGRASVYRQSDGTLTLRLTDFHTTNGPDLHVVLTKASDPALQITSPSKALMLIEVGVLKGNEGDQDYALSSNIDLAQYNTVAIYCERLHAVFGAGNLEKF